MRPALTLTLALIATPAAAQITDASARDFAAHQEAAWNAGKLDRYFAGFTSDATFTDQAYVGDKPPVPYGTSTLAQARAQARKSLAKGPSREAGQVLRVEIAPGATSARIVSRVITTITAAGKTRRACATRVQTIAAGPPIRAKRQTDTFFNCPR